MQFTQMTFVYAKLTLFNTHISIYLLDNGKGRNLRLMHILPITCRYTAVSAIVAAFDLQSDAKGADARTESA